MNRADLIKFVAQKTLEDAEDAEMATGVADHEAGARFRRLVAEHVRAECRGVIDHMLSKSGGCAARVVVDVKYTLFDDELANPRDHAVAIIRDGEDYDCTLRLQVPIEIGHGTIRCARDNWIKAVKAHLAAEQASRLMRDAKAAAWAKVVATTLDETVAGAHVKDALKELRAEIKREGLSAVAEKLGVEE